MGWQHIQLAQGVDLLSECTERFKTGLFSVTLTVPLSSETATEYALIPGVLYRGSRKHPNIHSLSAATDYLYGTAVEVGVRQRGESQCICIQAGFIDDRFALDGMAVLEPVIELVGELLLDPAKEGAAFVQEYVASEGNNLADQIEGRINDKGSWAVFRLLSEMCEGEAFALDKLGCAERAREITAPELWENYEQLLDKAKIVFYYNGSAPHERVKQAVCRVFQRVLYDRDAPVDCLVLSAPAGTVRQRTETLDVNQGRLLLGFRTGGITVKDPRYPALLVFNAMFGGTGTSRLFANVRERLQLCYHVSSMIDKLKGILLVSAGLDFEDFGAAQQEILAQLEEIRQGKFTENELEAARRVVRSGLVSRTDSQFQSEDDAVTAWLSMKSEPGHGVLTAAIDRVTAEQVADAAGLLGLDMVYCLTGKEF